MPDSPSVRTAAPATASAADPVPLDPSLFAPGPARDGRFVVKDRWRDCVNYPDGHALHQVQFTHRQMNEEVNGLECSARCLSDFPETEWELRMSFARQCADEARHAWMFRHQPIVDGQYGSIGDFGKLARQSAVTLGAAHGVGPAMDVEQATPMINAGCQHPFGRDAGRVDGDDLGRRIAVSKQVVHVVTQQGQMLAARRALERCGNAAERGHHRLVRFTGRSVDQIALAGGLIKSAQVSALQIEGPDDPDGHDQRQHPQQYFSHLGFTW